MEHMYLLYGINVEDSTDADWEALVNQMDDDVREEIHRCFAPCTRTEFLAEYLKRDPSFEEVANDIFAFSVIDYIVVKDRDGKKRKLVKGVCLNGNTGFYEVTCVEDDGAWAREVLWDDDNSDRFHFAPFSTFMLKSEIEKCEFC